MNEKSEAYLAGYNCGYTKPDIKNCHFKYFETKLLMDEWTKGKSDGEKDKSEIEKIKN